MPLPADSPEIEPLLAEVRTMLDENRQRCAWFLRTDFTPQNLEEARIALRAIVKRCDHASYIRAAGLLRQLTEPQPRITIESRLTRRLTTDQ